MRGDDGEAEYEFGGGGRRESEVIAIQSSGSFQGVAGAAWFSDS